MLVNINKGVKLIVEIHDQLKQPQRIKCSRIVVRDDYDNPLAVAVETAKDITTLAHINDPDFKELLKVLGIGSSVIITDA